MGRLKSILDLDGLSNSNSPLKYLDMAEDKEGTTEEQPQETEEKVGAILAPIQIIIPVDDSEEEEEEKPKKKKKKKGPKKADKVRNLTLSLGEALSLIMKEERKKKRQVKDDEIRRLALEQKARKAAASGHDVVRQGVLIHI